MFARTKRLTLRPGWPEDAPALTQAIAHHDIAHRLARLPWPYTEDHAAEWLARPRTPTTTDLLILSHEHDYPRIVGGIGLTGGPSGNELGYWLTPAVWGRGYATEAGRAVLHMAQHALGVKRVASGHFLDNPASGHVLRKLGFRETHRASRPCLARGHDVPSAEFALEFGEDQNRESRLAA